MCRPVMWSPARFLRISVSMAVLSSGPGVARFQFEHPRAETRAADKTSDANAFFIRQPPACVEQCVFQNEVTGSRGCAVSRGLVAGLPSCQVAAPLIERNSADEFPLH